MTIERSFIRTVDDLIEKVNAIARQFQADEVFIVGSQSILSRRSFPRNGSVGWVELFAKPITISTCG